MAYASRADVVAILPDDEGIPGTAEERLKVNLEEATDLVIAYLGREYTGEDEEPEDEPDGVPDDVPGAVRRVVARVALRAFMDNSEKLGALAETNLMGPFSHTINWNKEAQAGDFYLTKSDELRLGKYRLATSRTAGHAPMIGAAQRGGALEWWL